MKCIDEVPAAELKGKRVLVRAGLDVSLDKDGEVIDLLRAKSVPYHRISQRRRCKSDYLVAHRS